LQHAIDTGHILMQAKLSISENETAGELHDRMKVLGAELLVQTLQQLLTNGIAPLPQADLVALQQQTTLHHAPKIFTETCRIEFAKPAATVHNLIRGLSPFPGAFTTLHQKTLKIYRSRIEMATHNHPPGTVSSDGKSYLRFATPDGFVYATELQLEGKKRMTVDEFLRGYRMQ
jgi:methionyl-tRNA formyltransferase